MLNHSFDLVLSAPYSNCSHYSVLPWVELFSYANFPFSFVTLVTLDNCHITHCRLNGLSILFHVVSFTESFKVLLLPSAPYCFLASDDILLSIVCVVWIFFRNRCCFSKYHDVWCKKWKLYIVLHITQRSIVVLTSTSRSTSSNSLHVRLELPIVLYNESLIMETILSY